MRNNLGAELILSDTSDDSVERRGNIQTQNRKDSKSLTIGQNGIKTFSPAQLSFLLTMTA